VTPGAFLHPRLGFPIRPGGLGDDDRERIHRLAARGWGASRIARKIEKHPSTVGSFMYREGLRAPSYRRSRPGVRGNGRVVKPFDAEEDAFITALRIQGFGPTKIADLTTKRFGHPRSKHTILCRLTMLAAREADEPIAIARAPA
jgi:hypothetical protein